MTALDLAAYLQRRGCRFLVPCEGFVRYVGPDQRQWFTREMSLACRPMMSALLTTGEELELPEWVTLPDDTCCTVCGTHH